MIRIYCQYSYGGFKTFRINGEANEHLTQVVTAENHYDFPLSANLYFNQGGAKMLYRFLDRRTLSLIVKEIPGHDLDTDNRPVSCAVQFVGDAEDRSNMDRLAIHIANNLKKFEKDFANMFNLHGGLHFDGDKLNALVQQCSQKCIYEGWSELLNITSRIGKVLLFVPFSDRFGIDKQVTKKVIKDLDLPEDVAEDDCVIRYSQLTKCLQYRIEEKTLKEDMSINENIDNVSLAEALKDKEKECSYLRGMLMSSYNETASFKTKIQFAILTMYCVGAMELINLIINIFKS